MLIRVGGYNAGIKEYLEEGQKSGRELSRDELDERIILNGDLNLTDSVYRAIPDSGQERYMTVTIGFKEDDVSEEILSAITSEFKSFLMKEYRSDEYNFYAEAHIPKVKYVTDKRTGNEIERKPHIHIVIPRVNLLTGNEMNPRGVYKENEQYFEAFQEYINQKYNLISPRESMRVDPTNVADILSRYKGDDFRAKNRDFKTQVLERVINENILSRSDFYNLISSYGEVKIRNKGKDSEYIAVKLPGDQKFTNLKESIFSDEFIVDRKLSKPPLEKSIINDRFTEWIQRAKELKYVHKDSQTKRDKYYSLPAGEKLVYLEAQKQKFYQTNGAKYDLRTSRRSNHNKSGITETESRSITRTADSLQNMSNGNVAGLSAEKRTEVLLPGDARVHMAIEQTPGNSGLRRPLPTGRRGRVRDRNTASESRINPGYKSIHRERRLEPILRSTHVSYGRRDLLSQEPVLPRINNRIPTVDTVSLRSDQLFGANSPPTSSGNINKKFKIKKSLNKSLFKTPYPVLPRFKNNIPTLSDVVARTNSLYPTDTISKGKKANATKLFILPTNKPSRGSTVPEWLMRRFREESLGVEHRQLLRKIDSEFFDIRREVVTDERFTYDEKNQLISVLSFERLKKKDAVFNKQEVYIMGSQNIKDMLNKRTVLEGYTISAPEHDPKSGFKNRLSSVMERMRNPVNYPSQADKAREKIDNKLDASNLYSKRTRKGHVHYLNKTSDKTLFVDTGKLISMRKNGLSKDGVAIALELAQGRFGSTLNIKGSQKFKDMVVEVVAERGLDIHFTDKRMNLALEQKRAELALRKENKSEGFSIEGAEPTQQAKTVPDHNSMETVESVKAQLFDLNMRPMMLSDDQKRREFRTSPEDIYEARAQTNAEIIESRTGVKLDPASLVQEARDAYNATLHTSQPEAPRQSVETVDSVKAQLFDLNMRPMMLSDDQKRREFQTSPADIYEARARTNAEIIESRTGVKLDPASLVQEARDAYNATLHTSQPEAPRQSVETVDSVKAQLFDLNMRPMMLSDDQKRREFQTSPADIYEARARTNAEIIESRTGVKLDPASLVQEAREAYNATLHSASAPQKTQERDRVIQGTILKHGRAPYPDGKDAKNSYFVVLRDKSGAEHTRWGVGLEQALEGYVRGNKISLEFKGSKPVTVQTRDDKGVVAWRDVTRNVWEVTPLSGKKAIEAKQRNQPQQADKAPGKGKASEGVMVDGFRTFNNDPSYAGMSGVGQTGPGKAAGPGKAGPKKDTGPGMA